MAGAAPSTAPAQATRPKICVTAEATEHLHLKLLRELPGQKPEEVVADAAIRVLAEVKVFDFVADCPRRSGFLLLHTWRAPAS